MSSKAHNSMLMRVAYFMERTQNTVNRVELETNILGILLIEGHCVSEVRHILTANNFSDDFRKEVFRACLDEPRVDLMTINTRIHHNRSREGKDSKDVAVWLAQMTERVNTSANLLYWCFLLVITSIWVRYREIIAVHLNNAHKLQLEGIFEQYIQMGDYVPTPSDDLLGSLPLMIQYCKTNQLEELHDELSELHKNIDKRIATFARNEGYARLLEEVCSNKFDFFCAEKKAQLRLCQEVVTKIIHNKLTNEQIELLHKITQL
jgi:DnaB-like helicase N terminal domain